MLDLDLTVADSCKRRGGGACWPTAATGGERRRSSPARPKPGFPASVWRVDCVYAKRARRRSNQRRRLRRGCNGAAGRRGGAARLRRRSPASLYRRYGARGRQHVTRVACSPSHVAAGLLLVDEIAATTRIRRQRQRARVRVSGGAREAKAARVARVARVGNPRGGGRL
jgi:hypothetical protein